MIEATKMDHQSPPSQRMESMSVSPPNGDSSSKPTSKISAEEKFKIIRSIGEECIQDDELKDLLSKKPQPICYDGFEPSGKMHIAQGVMKVINVNKLVSAGCKVKIWIADWFALMNKKMGGDLDKIQTVGLYLIEIWKAMGLDIQDDKVEFLWSSHEINSQADKYLPLVMDIARRNNLNRIKRCCQIMGRSEQDELAASQFFYPCMQCADVFFLEADICQLGMDQRKVNVLAREYCDDIKRKNKPIILSHHMLPGLQQGQEKMSKSNPLSSIFMDDEEEKVNSKIENAYCPLKVVERNPCLEYIKYIIFPWFMEFKIECGADNGDHIFYKNFEDLADDYESGKLHPDVLKPALSKALNKILQPVRDHFRNNPKAKDLLERIEAFAVESHQTGHQTLPSQDQESLNISLPNEAMSSTSAAQMTAEEKFEIITRVGEECIQVEELRKLLSEKPQPICYDEFEPSGRMHFAEGILKIINVNKLISAGCKIKILVADWLALLNNKLGGDLKKIKTVGNYMYEIWKAMGLPPNGDKVEFLWSSEKITSRPHEYLPLLLDIATKNRMNRCLEVIGRTDEEDRLMVSQIFHTCMQCADIIFFKVDICLQGKDQREVSFLAREYCDVIKRKDKPIVLSHNMLPGLQGQEKMSKSDPIFMDDEEAEVNLKIKKAVCPPKEVEGNPCLEYIEFIIFPWFNELKVERRPDHGGDIIYQSFKELAADYKCGKLHPGDLKPALSKAINMILKPVRDHFKSDPSAKELLKKVKGYKVTR